MQDRNVPLRRALLRGQQIEHLIVCCTTTGCGSNGNAKYVPAISIFGNVQDVTTGRYGRDARMGTSAVAADSKPWSSNSILAHQISDER